MIDYLLAFADEPTARADPVVGSFWIPADDTGDPGAWRGDVCIPGVQVVVIATGAPVDALWRIIIAQMNGNAALASHPNLQLAANRDMANAGDPPSAFILSSTVPAAEWPNLAVTPVFAGSNYPFGQP